MTHAWVLIRTQSCNRGDWEETGLGLYAGGTDFLAFSIKLSCFGIKINQHLPNSLNQKVESYETKILISFTRYKTVTAENVTENSSNFSSAHPLNPKEQQLARKKYQISRCDDDHHHGKLVTTT